MERFELDRLFGLALTDARFFRQLREHPRQAVAQFELTDSETQAVLSIAPAVGTTQELAVQLDAWMTGSFAVIPVPASQSIQDVDPVPQQLPISDHARLDSGRRQLTYSYSSGNVQTRTRRNERITCLNLSECISPN